MIKLHSRKNLGIRPRSWFLMMLLAGCTLTACGETKSDDGSPASDPEPFHPMAASIPAEDAVDFVLGRGAVSSPSVAAFVDALRVGEPVAVLGEEEGDTLDSIGSIEDAALLPDGWIVVLDGKNNHIKRYASDGRLLGALGRSGAGPGELEHVVAMDVDETGSIYVLDRRRRVTRFRADGAAAETLNLPISGADLCVMGGEIFVRGYAMESAYAAGLVHVFSPDGKHLRSFGEPYQAVSSYASYLVNSEGGIVCDRASRSIVASFMRYPVLQGFSADGARLWSSKIPMEKLFRFEMRGEEAHYGPPVPGTAIVGWMMPGPAGQVFVRVTSLRDEGAATRTYAVDVEKGSGAEVDVSQLRLYATDGKLVLGREASLYPMLSVYQLER